MPGMIAFTAAKDSTHVTKCTFLSMDDALGADHEVSKVDPVNTECEILNTCVCNFYDSPA